jgi:hypothetical protein
MDSLTDTTKIYTVQPGCRYVIGYESDDSAASLTVGWFGDADVVNPFTLADGTTTEKTFTDAFIVAGGWEVLAVTNKIHAVVTGTVSVTLARVEN